MDQDAVGFVGLAIVGLISLLFLAVWIWSLVWSYADAEARGRSGCLVALLVALCSWPFSLLLWVVSRPDRRRD